MLFNELGPGLHRVGPAPYDFVYNPAKGQRVTFIGLDGRQFTGTVVDFTDDDDIQLTIE